MMKAIIHQAHFHLDRLHPRSLRLVVWVPPILTKRHLQQISSHKTKKQPCHIQKSCLIQFAKI